MVDTPYQTLVKQRNRLQAQLTDTTTQIGQLESRETTLSNAVGEYNLAIDEIAPAPVNTVAPVASGAATVGVTLSVTDGTWTYDPASYAYAWQDSDDGETGWAAISGATSATYLVDAADEDKYIRCVVTATNAGGSTAANSNVLGPVIAA